MAFIYNSIMIEVKCINCGAGRKYLNECQLKRRNKTGLCRSCALKGKSYNWKGGKYVNKKGYVCVRNTTHPCNNAGYVLEHRLVIEKNLGRILGKNEVIHHKNGNRQDNKLENLELLNRSDHQKIHWAQRRATRGTHDLLIHDRHIFSR